MLSLKYNKIALFLHAKVIFLSMLLLHIQLLFQQMVMYWIVMIITAKDCALHHIVILLRNVLTLVLAKRPWLTATFLLTMLKKKLHLNVVIKNGNVLTILLYLLAWNYYGIMEIVLLITMIKIELHEC